MLYMYTTVLDSMHVDRVACRVHTWLPVAGYTDLIIGSLDYLAPVVYMHARVTDDPSQARRSMYTQNCCSATHG